MKNKERINKPSSSMEEGAKQKRNKLLLVATLFFYFIIFVSLVYAATWVINNKAGFDEGTYNNTYYNETNNAVQLNLSFDSGNYTSRIFDTGGISSYQNLSWHEQRIECPEGMAYINKLNGFCIDKYEASVPGCDVIGENCAMTGWADYCAANCVPDSGAFGDTAGTGTTGPGSPRLQR